MMKSFAAGLAGTALLATFAFAQTPPATTDKTPTAATVTTTTASDQWRISKMSGVKVYNEANENIGSINDLLMDKSGNVKIAVIGVGGFLGMGEHLVAVPYEKLKFVNEPIAYSGTAATNPPGRPATTTTTGAATGTDRPAAPAATSTASKWYPDHAVFNASKDELKNMPEFKYSE